SGAARYRRNHVRCAARHAGKVRRMSKDGSITLGNVKLWPPAGEMIVAGMPHHLSKEPARILGILLEASPRVVTHDRLHTNIGSLKTQVARLRAFLRESGANVVIVTAKGIGLYAQ